MSEIIEINSKYNPEDENPQQYENYYLKIRKKVEKWAGKNSGKPIAELVLILPDAVYLLIQLLKDERVPAEDKMKIAMAMVYIVSPVDIIPDIIPGIGQLDDLYVALLLIETLFLKYPDVVESHWPGDVSNLHSIQTILEKIKEHIGSDKLRQVLEMFKGKFKKA
ncbi:MAG: hypothetical protein Kow00108_19670 [Calditrichia bacterium]